MPREDKEALSEKVIRRIVPVIPVISCIAAGALLMSCQTAPIVSADLTEHLPARSADSVMVFRTAEAVPTSARVIGTVKVKDGGLTPTKDCLFPNMLALAIKKTAESGGNAFHIDEHKYPGFHGSTCYRVKGTIYLMPDSLITADTRSTLNSLEAYEDDLIQARASKMITDVRDRRLNNPRNVLRIGAGPAWIVSEIETFKALYKSKIGFSLSADYQHLWRSGIGIGVNYLYYGTSFDEGFDIRMHYFGPSIVASVMLGQKWRWASSFGIGYTHYKESATDSRLRVYANDDGSTGRVGTMFKTGFEYMLSKNVGIGLQIDFFVMSLKKPEGLGDKYDFYGIRRIDPQMSIQYYL